MNELLSNLPVKNLDKENDWFGTLPKGMAIKNFLESNQFFNSENKMVVLYGGWGSGKTTLMRYLEKNLDRKKYAPIFFEAWQFEKDDNLVLSLADLLKAQIQDKKTQNKFWKSAYKVLKGFAKGISVKIEPVSVDPGKMIDSMEKDFSKANTKVSFYEDLRKFKNLLS